MSDRGDLLAVKKVWRGCYSSSRSQLPRGLATAAKLIDPDVLGFVAFSSAAFLFRVAWTRRSML